MTDEEKKENVSLGEFLSQKRKEKGFSLEKISQETKINLSYLRAIEEDDYSNLPPPVYLRAIIKKYSRYLHLDPDEVLKILTETNHRQWMSGEKDTLPKNRFAVPQSRIVVYLRNFFSQLLKFILFFIIVGYIFYELSFLVFPPKIILFSPSEDYSTNQKELNISGKVIRAKSVFLKNQVLTLDEKGNFFYTLILNPGLNQIEIKATNHLGREAKVIRNINYVFNE